MLVSTDWLTLKMVPLLYFKVDINFVLGRGPGWDNITNVMLA
jgi:hypothetical protein